MRILTALERGGAVRGNFHRHGARGDVGDGVADDRVEDVRQYHIELCGALAQRTGDIKQQDEGQAERDHGDGQPGPGLAPFGVGMVDDGAHDQIRNAVQNPGKEHHIAHKDGAQQDAVRVVGGQEGADNRAEHIDAEVANAVAHPPGETELIGLGCFLCRCHGKTSQYLFLCGLAFFELSRSDFCSNQLNLL